MMLFSLWTMYKIIFDPMMWLWEMLMPKAKQPDKIEEKPDIPTTEIGTKIPEIYGTEDIKTTLLAWWGDVRIVPFYSEVSKK